MEWNMKWRDGIELNNGMDGQLRKTKKRTEPYTRTQAIVMLFNYTTRLQQGAYKLEPYARQQLHLAWGQGYIPMPLVRY